MARITAHPYEQAAYEGKSYGVLLRNDASLVIADLSLQAAEDLAESIKSAVVWARYQRAEPLPEFLHLEAK